nr:amino acid adenylation domain-containing protein [Deltaproteobacteria bacterium]
RFFARSSAELVNAYGPTEAVVYATHWRCRPGDTTIPIGFAGANTTMHVFNETLQEVPEGSVGELYIGGVQVARGYASRPELTAERFIQDPFGAPGARLYKTGDLVRQREDGALEFLGRADHQVKVRGFRIELGEIEAVLCGHPGVRNAVVVVKDQALVAYVVRGKAFDPVAVRAHLSSKLPDYMVPAALVPLDAFPVTTSGKIDRAALPEAAASAFVRREYIAPRTEAEQALAAIWSELLKQPKIGVRDDFFELGGHSLLAMRAASRVRARFGVELPLRCVFETPTLEGLAEVIRNAATKPSGPAVTAVRRGDRPLLSFAQQRLWFLHQLEPDSAAYHVALARRLHGPLDVEALRCALEGVIGRHESLRTTFQASDGVPYQEVRPAGRWELVPEDGSELDDAGLQSLAAEEARRPFDLEAGPLVRTRLVRISDDEHVFLATFHHIITDGWSTGIFWRELGSLYAGVPLPVLPIQYADYAAWQRSWVADDELAGQLSYWTAQLRGAPEELALPFKAARPARQTDRAAERCTTLGRELTAKLLGLASRHGATLFMTLAAGLRTLLARYAGHSDICIGTAIANRKHDDIEGLIGFFINTLVLRGTVGATDRFIDLLEREKQLAIDAYDHQDAPFEMIVNALGLERNLSRTPLFQVWFVHQNYEGELMRLAGLRADPLLGAPAASKFDLTLYTEEIDGTIQVTCHYNPDLFDASTIERLLAHYDELLSSVAGREEIRVDELLAAPTSPCAPDREVPTPPEHRRMDAPAGDHGVWARFLEISARFPDHHAIVEPDRSWTYAMLASRAAAIGARLASEHPRRVGLAFGHGGEMVAAMLGALADGTAYVPLDPSNPVDRLVYMLRDSEVDVVLCDAAHEQLARSLDPSVRVICTAHLPAERLARPRGGADALAYILYTSGSTGQPKGVMQSQRNLLHHVGCYTNNLRVTASDRLSLLSTYAFDAAVMDIYGAVLTGAALCPWSVRTLGLANITSWIESTAVTIFHSTPTVFRELIVSAGSEARFPTVRAVVLGGEGVSRDDFERYCHHFAPTSIFVNGLGPTESTLALQSFWLPGETVERARVPVGYPVDASTEVSLSTPLGRQLAVHGVGELVIQSDHIALGYWNRPLETAAAFRPTPGGRRAYHTGDLGRLLPDGRIEHAGRIDSQVKIRGYRIELAEIESVIASLSGIAACAVVLRDGLRGEPQIIAFVVRGAEPAVQITASELSAQLATRLPSYMVPAAIVIVPDLPKTSTGKVDRRALPDVAAPMLDHDELEAPRTPEEETLAQIWSELLGVARVGIRDDFFALGGHSLLAIRVVSQVRASFAVELPLRALFETPTVEGLAREVARLRAGGELRGAPPLVALLHRERPPLSHAQQRMWFLHQLDPASAAYAMSFARRLRGPLDSEALRRAIEQLVHRHEPLRTVFPFPGGEPYQQIHPPARWELVVEDHSMLDEVARERELARIESEEATRPFDLAVGPLVRTRLVRLSDEDHVLWVTMHHIVSDGWSMRVFWRELGEFYPAVVEGKSPALAPLPVGYADYAAWQRSWLQGDELVRQLRYWKEQLQGAPEEMALPFKAPRPPQQTVGGREIIVELDAELSTQLRTLARREGATLFMTLAAALRALLARYTGQDDLVLGTPIANRNRREIEGLIGLFVNTVVLRNHVRGAESFVTLLAREKEVALAAFDHQETPFELVVDALGLERHLSRTPLFQVMYSHAAIREEVTELTPGLAMTRASASGDVEAAFDLSVTTWEHDHRINVSWIYNVDLFDAAIVEQMARHLRNLLAAAVARPDRAIGALVVLDAGERHQLLVEWNATARDFPNEQCLHELIEQQVERTPDAIAIVFGEAQLSYRDLSQRSNGLAHRLRALGIGPGSIVGVYLARSLDLVVSQLAVWKAGAAYLPISPDLGVERVAYMLDDARARLLISDEALAAHLTTATPVLRLDRERSGIVGRTDGPSREGGGSDSPAYVIYTSGSTGKPKGSIVSHRSLGNLIAWHVRTFGLAPGDRASQLAGLAFDASAWETWPPLVAGATLCLVDDELRANPRGLRDWFVADRISIAFVPTPLAEPMLELEWPSACELRTLLTGGDRLVRRPRPGLPFVLVNNYGPTECTVLCLSGVVTPPTLASQRAPDLGRPTDNVQVYVLDDRREPVPIGVCGELYIGGEGVGDGYLGRPELTAEKFVKNPFGVGRLYQTGDLARWLPDGAVEFVGRLDQQVQIRGFRVELGEIEATLGQHPSIREVVVVAREDAPGEKQLVAYVVGRDAPPDAVALRGHLKEKLPEYMVPAAFVVLDALPLTPNGKLDRKALPAPAGDAFQRAEYVAPRTPEEETLAQIWSDLLGVPRVGIRDDFFAIGGHSLLAARVVSRISAALGVAVPVRLIFDAPTIAGLARRLESKAVGESELALARQDPDRRRFPLSLAQERLVFLDRLEPGSRAYILPFAVRLKGELRAAVLKRAFEEIVRRHAALRTTIEVDGGVSVQVIHDGRPLAWEQRDVTALVTTGGELALVEEATREARRPFDLRRGPLFRTTLLEIGAREHVLVVSVHHIISDGWSLGILARELEVLYAAYSAGRESPLPDLAVQYGDYAVWERARLTAAALDSQLAYWKRHLLGAPPALELPTDHPRPLVQKHRGAVLSGHLSAEVAERLARVARRNGATLYMTLLAAFTAVLSRSTGQADIVVATPIANRPRPETEQIFGFFMNTVAIRVATGHEATFEAMLARARDASLGAFANQDVPFDRVVQELNPVRDMSRNVIAQVSLNLLNLSDTSLALDGIIAERVNLGDVGSKYDLTLYADERDGLRLGLVFDADLFDAHRMTRLVRRLERILDEMSSRPSSRIDDVSFLLDDERTLLPDPTAPLPARQSPSVTQLFDDRVRDAPQRDAVIDPLRSWTYADLGARSNQLAHWLRAQGIGEGDVVAVYAGRSALTVWALLAVLKAGAAFTVLDATYPSARLKEQLRIAAPSAWISAVDSGSPASDLAMLMPSMDRRVDLAGASDPWSALPTTPPEVVPRPGTRAYVAFTSGTSGGPKGIAGGHGPLSHFVEWHATTHALGPEDRFSGLSGVAHDPFLRDIFTPLSVGAAICLPADDVRREPQELAAWLANERISICHLTPSLGEVLTHAHAASLPALRWACFAGEALDGALVRALRKIAPRAGFVSFYGATETPQAMGYYVVPDEPPVGAVPIGRGIDDSVQLLVVNAVGHLAGVDEPGEIVVRTPHLAVGYVGSIGQGGFDFNRVTGDPADRVYRTGDQGRFLADGNVQMVGRLDDQVKVRGYRVELGELEGVVRSLAGVRQAVAVLDEPRRSLVVYASGAVEVDAIRQSLRQRLPDYMVPSRIILLESLPLTPSGKIDRRALPALEDETPGSPGEGAASGSVEESLVEIWKDVLGLSQVALDGNFFDIGGHSLAAMQIAARIRDAFDVEIAVRTVFEAPTITELATQVVDAVLLAASPELLTRALGDDGPTGGER